MGSVFQWQIQFVMTERMFLCRPMYDFYYLWQSKQKISRFVPVCTLFISLSSTLQMLL